MAAESSSAVRIIFTCSSNWRDSERIAVISSTAFTLLLSRKPETTFTLASASGACSPGYGL